MGLLRSEVMKRGVLFVPRDMVAASVEQLAISSNIHYQDMNETTMSRPNRLGFQRLEEMERQLRFLFDELTITPDVKVVSGQVDEFVSFMHPSADEGRDTDAWQNAPVYSSDIVQGTCGHPYTLNQVEKDLNTFYGSLQRLKETRTELDKELLEAREETRLNETAVLMLKDRGTEHPHSDATREDTFVGPVDSQELRDSMLQEPRTDRSVLGGARGGAAGLDMGFSSIAGVMNQTDAANFNRTLFRSTRGNAYAVSETIDDDKMNVVDKKTKVSMKRSVVVVWYQAGTGSVMHNKILNLCNAYNVTLYYWPRDAGEADRRINKLGSILSEKEKAAEAFNSFYVKECQSLVEVPRHNSNSRIQEWQYYVNKEKSVLAVVDMFESRDLFLSCNVWYAEMEETQIQKTISTLNESDLERGRTDFKKTNSASEVGQSMLDNQVVAGPVLIAEKQADRRGAWGGHGGGGTYSPETPPTYNRVTSFTDGFQGMVDTYGVSRYREANPALLTIVTFPFLFGVMYGDVGHGFFVFLFGLSLVILYPILRKSSDEVVQMMRSGRWILLMAGFFGVYAGFMYNDMFALGFDIFGERYTERPPTADENPDYIYFTQDSTVYPLGVDPVWRGAQNEIVFTNSIKMKLSVIFAFVQMSFGLFMKLLNCIHFRSGLDFFFEWIPQIIFLCSLVGYLDFLIIFKWVTPDTGDNKPQLINLVINMFFFTPPDQEMFPGQAELQLVLVALIFICVPIMLFPKPIIQYTRYKKELGQTKGKGDDKTPLNPTDPGGTSRDVSAIDEVFHETKHKKNEHEEEEGFMDFFIHQMIETIEFALGTISNTASYLRLWALSLAHQQLSDVIIQYSLLFFLQRTGVSRAMASVGLFLCVPVFFVLTFAIMLMMETLECYLHALR
eukprot:GHVN01013057.1.p1 GENE.GHVN01013057.1~~GHVN01013057.1.p1  ORF type:complete len:899 (+),score=133.18 GHVN01013057.1:482-3178(+)